MQPGTKGKKRNNILLPVLLFAIANCLITGLAFQEQLAYKNGLAWDSGIYYRAIQHGIPGIFRQQLSFYYVQRVLPGLVADLTLKVLHAPAIGANVLRVYTVLDWVCLNVAAIFIWRIMVEIGASYRTRLGALLLFFTSFFVLKCALYMPVLTDAPALCLATLMVHAHFSRLRRWLLCLILASAFTQPLLPLMGGLLFLFPYRKETIPVAGTRPSHAGTIAVLAGLLFLGLHFLFRTPVTSQVSDQPHPVTPVQMEVYYLSLGLATLFVWLAAFFLAGSCSFRSFFRNGSLSAAAMLAVLLIGCRLVQHKMANAEPVAMDAGQYGMNILQQSVAFPAGFLVAHINFFGPAVLVLLLRFRAAAKHATTLGTGILLCLIAALPLALGSESRQLLPFFPVLVILAALVLGERLKAGWQWIGIAAIGLTISRFWWQINTASFTGIPQQYPDQRLFMNYAPWMTASSYRLLLGLEIVTLLLAALILKGWPFSGSSASSDKKTVAGVVP